MKLNFRCSGCQAEAQLEEVLVNATVTSTIRGRSESEDVDYEFVAKDIYDGKLSHFRCVKCGNIVRMPEGRKVGSYGELWQIAKARGWLE